MMTRVIRRTVAARQAPGTVPGVLHTYTCTFIQFEKQLLVLLSVSGAVIRGAVSPVACGRRVSGAVIRGAVSPVACGRRAPGPAIRGAVRPVACGRRTLMHSMLSFWRPLRRPTGLRLCKKFHEFRTTRKFVTVLTKSRHMFLY
jgi:hypothetical protein